MVPGHGPAEEVTWRIRKAPQDERKDGKPALQQTNEGMGEDSQGNLADS